MNTNTKKDEFINQIAAMATEGENYYADSAWTLSDLIDKARELIAEQPKTYTVILLYPDYLTDDFGADIYVDSAEAESLEEAVKLVQAMAASANSDDIEERDPNDFRCIGVIEGEHDFIADATSF